MPNLSHEKQINNMKLWRRREKEKNALKTLGYSNDEISLLDKTLNSKVWRMSHLYKIREEKGNLITFVPNRAQHEFIKGAHVKNIILKSRQLGFTTFECIDNFDNVLFEENFSSLMIFHKKEAAEDSFFNKITLAWDNIPNAIRSKFELNREKTGEMIFKHALGIYSSIACRTSGMSGTYSRLHVSELAPLCQDEPAKGQAIVTETFPAIPDSGRIDVESTARGNSGLYHNMFYTAYNNYMKLESELENPTGKLNNPLVQLDVSDFKPWFFNWTYDDKQLDDIYKEFWRGDGREKKDVVKFKEDIHPEIIKYQKQHNLTDTQIIYYWRKIKGKGIAFEDAWKIVKQEYPTTIEEAFEAKVDYLFDLEKIKELMEKATLGEPSGKWKYFTEYKPNHSYGIGVDVAEGVGRDSSAITILDFGVSHKDDVTVAATYVNDNIAPDILAYEIRNGARAYGNPIVAVERNNHGGTTLNELKGIYKNLYTEIRTNKINNEETDRLGWDTNPRSKPKMFYDLKTALNDDVFKCNARNVLLEMNTYDAGRLNKLRESEDETNHWDLLTSCCIAFQMRTLAKPSKIKRKQTEKVVFDRFSVI